LDEIAITDAVIECLGEVLAAIPAAIEPPVDRSVAGREMDQASDEERWFLERAFSQGAILRAAAVEYAELLRRAAQGEVQ
jgi:hypothetical protein